MIVRDEPVPVPVPGARAWPCPHCGAEANERCVATANAFGTPGEPLALLGSPAIHGTRYVPAGGDHA